MSREDGKGNRGLERLAREELSRQGPGHPVPERLTAYRAGELNEEAAEAVETHLAVCQECVAMVLEIPRFYADIERPGPTVDLARSAAATASLRAFRARLAAEGAEPGADVPAPARRVDGPTASAAPLRSAARRSQALAFAAGLAAACAIGIPLWTVSSRGASSSATPPTVIYLAHGAEIYREEPSTASSISFHLGQGTTLLLLPAPNEPDFARYRIDFVTPDGQLVARAFATPLPLSTSQASGLPREMTALPPRFLGCELAGPALPVGNYRLRLFGLSAGRAEKLAEHPLRVVAR